MSNDETRDAMARLMAPIEIQLMVCQTREEELMLACAMLTTAKDILLQQIGPQGAITIVQGVIDDLNEIEDDNE